MTTRFIMLTLIYVISMEFLPLSHRRFSSRNVSSGEERGETAVQAVFAGYPSARLATEHWLFNRPIMARAQILVHSWGVEQEFQRSYAALLNEKFRFFCGAD